MRPTSTSRRSPRSSTATSRCAHLAAGARHARVARARDRRLVRDHQPGHPRPQRLRRRDSPRCAHWIVEHLGPDVPLHFTAFHPDFRMRDVPPTPPATLRRARADRARERRALRLHRQRPRRARAARRSARAARAAVIERDWYAIKHYDLDAGGACSHCGTPLPGQFGTEPVALRSGFRRLRVAAP